MENFNKHYKNFILNNRQNYLKEIVPATTDEDKILNDIAEKICGDFDILEVENGGMPDGKFLRICKKIKLLCAEFDAIFLIKSRCDIAFLCDADGVYLEQDDINIHCAREILGENSLIGISVYNNKQVHTAVKDGADYIFVHFEIKQNNSICIFKNGNPIRKLS